MMKVKSKCATGHFVAEENVLVRRRPATDPENTPLCNRVTTWSFFLLRGPIQSLTAGVKGGRPLLYLLLYDGPQGGLTTYSRFLNAIRRTAVDHSGARYA
ncbi:hypothetical protein EYF80_011433 [Liparis tanakae]|uniref:Uncharacterized protein n=1 Tax=Liparis tanakae TaxID=230148 RepID=A0A4Z2IKD5_9TELE|nr:hypothetical protein EYF80_011433 [Liparis tanakae]